MHFESNTPPNVLFLNSIGGAIPLPQVLGVIVDCSFSPLAHIDAVFTEARGVITLLRRTFRRLFSHYFIPLYSEMVRLHLEYCVQAWVPALIHDIAKLDKLPAAAKSCPNCFALA